MNSNTLADHRLVFEVEKYSWCILVLLAVGSLFLFSHRVTLGVLTGGLISIFNFRWLKFFIGRVLFTGNARQAKALGRAHYLLRYFAMGLIFYVVLKAGISSAPAIFAGLSVVFLAITVAGIKRACRGGTEESK